MGCVSVWFLWATFFVRGGRLRSRAPRLRGCRTQELTDAVEFSASPLPLPRIRATLSRGIWNLYLMGMPRLRSHSAYKTHRFEPRPLAPTRLKAEDASTRTSDQVAVLIRQKALAASGLADAGGHCASCGAAAPRRYRPERRQGDLGFIAIQLDAMLSYSSSCGCDGRPYGIGEEVEPSWRTRRAASTAVRA